MPPELLTRGLGLGWLGLPLVLNPPAAICLCPSWGKRRGQATFLCRQPLPASGLPKPLPSLTGPVPAGRGPSPSSMQTGRCPPHAPGLPVNFCPVCVQGTHSVLAQAGPPSTPHSLRDPGIGEQSGSRGPGGRPAGQQGHRRQDKGLGQTGILGPIWHPEWQRGLPRRGTWTRSFPTCPMCVLSGIIAGRRESVRSLGQSKWGQDGRPWARARRQQVPEAGAEASAESQTAVPCSH